MHYSFIYHGHKIPIVNTLVPYDDGFYDRYDEDTLKLCEDVYFKLISNLKNFKNFTFTKSLKKLLNDNLFDVQDVLLEDLYEDSLAESVDEEVLQNEEDYQREYPKEYKQEIEKERKDMGKLIDQSFKEGEHNSSSNKNN